MDILGLTLQEFIYTIFLPFLFFYIFLYALLRKSKILGEEKEANRFNTLLSLVISALGILSLYTLGLTVWLPYLAAFLAVAAFFVLFVLGTLGFGGKKLTSYYSGEAFKTIDEKRFDVLASDCENLWKGFKKDKSQQKLNELGAKLSELEPLARKIGKNLDNFDWYKEVKKVASG